MRGAATVRKQQQKLPAFYEPINAQGNSDAKKNHPEEEADGDSVLGGGGAESGSAAACTAGGRTFIVSPYLSCLVQADPIPSGSRVAGCSYSVRVAFFAFSPLSLSLFLRRIKQFLGQPINQVGLI